MNRYMKSWLLELEKSDRKQCQGKLTKIAHNGEKSFCCLGVPMDMWFSDQGTIKSPEYTGDLATVEYKLGSYKSNQYLLTPVAMILGFKMPDYAMAEQTFNPKFYLNEKDPEWLRRRHAERNPNHPELAAVALDILNDVYEATFREIAQIIRNHPELYEDDVPMDEPTARANDWVEATNDLI